MSCNTCSDKTYNPCQPCYERSHEVVDTASEVSTFRDAYVTVLDENATYHIDGRGNAISISRNPIFSDTYSPHTGDYKMNTVYNFIVNEAYVFDGDGNYRTILLYSDGGSS